MSSVVIVTRDPQQALQWRDHLSVNRQYEVVAVTNAARSARALLQQHRPRVVVCELRLLDGTALAMIQWLAGEPDATRPTIVVVTPDPHDPLLREATRSGADNFYISGREGDTLAACVRRTLLGESTLTPALAQALLDHFERLAPRSRDFNPIDAAQSPLQLEPAERDLLIRVAAGVGIDELAEQRSLNPHGLGVLARAVFRKLQWDQRAGSLSLQLA